MAVQPTVDRVYAFGVAFGIPVDARPTLAVAIGQALFGVADEAGGSLAASVDLACAFDLLGVEAQVIHTTRGLLRSLDDQVPAKVADGHHVVYVPLAHRMIDPGLSHAIASTNGLPQPEELLPGITKVASLDQLRQATNAVVTSNGVVATYDGATIVTLPRNGGVPGETIFDRASPLLAALRAIHSLCMAGDFAEISLRHPDLADLLVRVDLPAAEDTATRST
ncbi:hypothetical protein [Actinokineospora baliensis]|uniref:hypothetical protein n=1 Tax=Actinokineospora baliensis TaxID=547056 RepID=UPI001958F586|nr:hypothetical protein [Actinokineospora baliensis]